MDKIDVYNKLYNGTMVTIGVAVVGFVGRKTIKDGLGTPTTAMGTGKLLVAIALSTVGVHCLQQHQKVMPYDPFGTTPHDPLRTNKGTTPKPGSGA